MLYILYDIEKNYSLLREESVDDTIYLSSPNSLTNYLIEIKRRTYATVTRYRIPSNRLCLRVQTFISFYKLLFHVRISSNVAAFDISIPRLTKDSFEMSFIRADIRHRTGINDCNRSLSRAS